jgi:hypothetical protein
VRIYWINREGNYQLYARLPAGATWLIVTFLDHPWLVVDARGKTQALFRPTTEPGRAVIRVKP